MARPPSVKLYPLRYLALFMLVFLNLTHVTVAAAAPPTKTVTSTKTLPPSTRTVTSTKTVNPTKTITRTTTVNPTRTVTLTRTNTVTQVRSSVLMPIAFKSFRDVQGLRIVLRVKDKMLRFRLVLACRWVAWSFCISLGSNLHPPDHH